MRRTLNVISLGCSKNLVDAERLMRMLAEAGCDVAFEQPVGQRFDAVVINTCGFISDAKEESIGSILEWVAAKERGLVGRVFVMGCLSERYASELPAEIPEVDGWFGKRDWFRIAGLMAAREGAGCTPGFDRVLTTPPHHAYLKIAEGCNRRCAFCAIPIITGRHSSRPVEEIVAEARLLAGRGVKELNVIAQELTYYGLDLYGERRLAQLVEALSEVEGIEWIRLHYAYPKDFPMELLDVMASNPKVCRYLDIALQHAADPVLANMHRNITAAETRSLISAIRAKVPGIHLRTTLMVGFPGEGEEEFAELMQFVRDMRFERMGAFAYCEEEDTAAARSLADTVSADVKQRRLDELMALQEEISAEIQQQKVGQTLRVVIDREEEEFYVGRSEFDSPEVDPEVLVEKTVPLRPGSFVEVRVLKALPFELIAQVTGDTK